MDGPYTRATGRPATVVTTTPALVALTHPLRMRLLALLRRDGPATASELGRAVGESSGATSYHLRQLARYGFVEPDDVQPNKRDKRWRVLTDTTDVDLASPALPHDPVALAAVDTLAQGQVQRFARTLSATLRLPAAELEVWAPALASTDSRLRLTPELLAELRDELLQLVTRWAERGRALPEDAEGAREIAFYAGAVPAVSPEEDW